MEDMDLKTVIMGIHPKIKPIDNKYHIKFERDIITVCEVNRFSFSSTSLNVAITKVADLVARHPENYFHYIEIK